MAIKVLEHARDVDYPCIVCISMSYVSFYVCLKMVYVNLEIQNIYLSIFILHLDILNLNQIKKLIN
jgi:hypothetical protein